MQETGPASTVAVTEPPLVLGVYVGVLLMLEVVLLTANFDRGWRFPGHGFVTLLPLYLLEFLLAFWILANENRNTEHLKASLRNRKRGTDGGAALDMHESSVIHATNRVWGFKVFFGTIPIIVMANLKMDLTRYDMSPWAVGGTALGVLLLFTIEGYARGKLWWHDSLKDHYTQLQEMKGDVDDLDS